MKAQEQTFNRTLKPLFSKMMEVTLLPVESLLSHLKAGYLNGREENVLALLEKITNLCMLRLLSQ